VGFAAGCPLNFNGARRPHRYFSVSKRMNVRKKKLRCRSYEVIDANPDVDSRAGRSRPGVAPLQSFLQEALIY